MKVLNIILRLAMRLFDTGRGKFSEAANRKKVVFLSFTAVEWEGHWTITQKMAVAISRRYLVFHINPRKELRHIMANIFELKGWLKFVTKVNNSLIVISPPNFFPKIYKWARIDRLIEKGYHAFVRCVVNIYSFKPRLILYIWEPAFSNFVAFYKDCQIVYHPYDMFNKYVYSSGCIKNDSQQTGIGDKIAQIGGPSEEERSLINKATVFCTVSKKLCEYYANTCGRVPFFMPNAADLEYFMQKGVNDVLARKARATMSKIPGIKLGYSGSLKGVLELDIVINVAKKNKDFSFVFIGKLIKTNIQQYDEKLEILLSLDNVYHLGHQEVTILPYLLREMDILMMIYSQNRSVWTYYGHPAKLFEYMATGKPIISTPHPAITEYSDLIAIVRNESEMVVAAKKMLSDVDEEKRKLRMEVAFENTWEKRVEKLAEDLGIQ